MTLDDLAVLMVYMAFLSALISLAGILEWLTEKVPFLNRLMDRWLEHMSLNPYDDDEEDYYDD